MRNAIVVAVLVVLVGLVGGVAGEAQAAAAQASPQPGSIAGIVVLQDSENPLHGARVLILQLGRSALTDEEGRFLLEGVPPGEYELLAVREHLQAARVVTRVEAGQRTELNFTLALAAIHEEVTITATGRETTVFDAFNSVQVLDSIDLAQNMAGSLGELLENEPGVAKRSFGPGSSRPIIRGFDNDRVLVMQDGVRTGDLSSQSGDHGSSVDPGSLQKVEVLKGPATLLYGSNAIGGVVNTISPHRQFYDDPPDELRGQINTDFATTNDQAGANGNFQYGDGRFMLWFGGGARRSGEVGTPLGDVVNSQSDSKNGRVGAGWFGPKGWFSGSYQIEDGEYGVPFAGGFAGEGDDVRINLAQRRQAVRFDGGLRGIDNPVIDGVKVAFSYVDWQHEEIERFADGTSEVGTRFDNDTYIGRIEFQQRPTGRLHGQFGIWGQRRDYVATGDEALAPPTRQSALAAFAYEEIDLAAVSVQLGGRIEHNSYQPDFLGPLPGRPTDSAALRTRDREFTGVSGSLGARLPLAGNRAALVANVTYSYRAPALEELYNFGPHVGNLAFEIGNPELGAERAGGGELSLRLNTGSLHGQASVFYYDITDFIFGAPTGEIVDGLTEIRFQQADSRFVGADLAMSVHLSPQWRFHLGGGVVDAKLTTKNLDLPRIPPLRVRLAVDWLPMSRLQVQPELIAVASQTDVFDTETPTDGYTLANLLASYTVAGSKTMHIFTLKATNLGDRLYRNHTSFIKDLAPETGRRLMFTYALRLF